MRYAQELVIFLEYVLAWQDYLIADIGVRIDGWIYVPAWVFGGDEPPVPAERLWELYSGTWPGSPWRNPECTPSPA